jgi:hypothetical protein
MIYQYFNINPIRIINQEILLLTGPKKWEADKITLLNGMEFHGIHWDQVLPLVPQHMH